MQEWNCKREWFLFFLSFWEVFFLCVQSEISSIFLSIWAPFLVHFGSILTPFWVPGGGPARLGVPRVYPESFLSVFYDFAARPNLGPDAFTSIKTVGSWVVPFFGQKRWRKKVSFFKVSQKAESRALAQAPGKFLRNEFDSFYQKQQRW